MTLTCPRCGSAIPMEDANVSTDLALCRACGNTYPFSLLVDASGRPGPSLPTPPAGAWFRESADGFTLGAITRSPMALFLIPFTCVWSGGSLGGIYGTQIHKGEFNLFSSLFGIPFLLGSVVLLSLCLMSVAGRIELRRVGETLTIFTGVGPLGWARNYPWDAFYFVREDTNSRNGWNSNRRQTGLALEGRTRAFFGSMWNDERRFFVMNVLRIELRNNARLAALSPKR